MPKRILAAAKNPARAAKNPVRVAKKVCEPLLKSFVEFVHIFA